MLQEERGSLEKRENEIQRENEILPIRKLMYLVESQDKKWGDKSKLFIRSSTFRPKISNLIGIHTLRVHHTIQTLIKPQFREILMGSK